MTLPSDKGKIMAAGKGVLLWTRFLLKGIKGRCQGVWTRFLLKAIRVPVRVWTMVLLKG